MEPLSDCYQHSARANIAILPVSAEAQQCFWAGASWDVQLDIRKTPHHVAADGVVNVRHACLSPRWIKTQLML
jgi:hypothetical protein